MVTLFEPQNYNTGIRASRSTGKKIEARRKHQKINTGVLILWNNEVGVSNSLIRRRRRRRRISINNYNYKS